MSSEARARHLREWLLPACLGVLLAVAMTWPLALHLGSDVPQDLVDPLVSAWHEAWIGHALLNDPGELFDANRFWPESDSLAFTDVSLGYAPAALVAAQGTHAAIVAYNLIFLFTYALAFLGAYLLSRELGACRLAAIVGGVAFAYAPFRLAQDGHMHVFSSGGIPLALFLLVRGYRQRRPALVLGGWLVTAWQVSLGFTLGVQLVYTIAAIGLVAGVYWFRRGRPELGRRVTAASVAGLCVLALVTFVMARPFLRVVDEHPEATRTPDLLAFFSPPVRGFLAASQDSFLWSGVTGDVWDSLSIPGEQALFPGIAILVLAGVGLFSSAYPATLRAWLAGGVLICALLSLGVRDESHFTNGWTPYRLLYELAPGWQGFRTPGRIHTLTTLGLALLAAAGATLILREVRTRRILRQPFQTRASRETAALVTAALLTGAILLEGFGPTQHPRAPSAPPGLIGLEDPQLHLPTDDFVDAKYTFWSIDGFPKIVNGGGSITPSRLREVRRTALDFPDARSVSLLRELGVRTVILHPELAVGTAWENTAERSTNGLPLVRQDLGDVVVYRLRR